MVMKLEEFLAQVKAREEKATAGPWDYEPTYVYSGKIHRVKLPFPEGQSHTFYSCGDGKRANEDAEFIAHARTDIPRLVKMVEETRSMLKAKGCDDSPAWSAGTSATVTHLHGCFRCALMAELDRIAGGEE